MSEAPGVGVVVPCFNQWRFVSDCIESLLAQTYPCSRILVIDDGSRDADRESVAARLRGSGVEVLQLENNVGVSTVRNIGFERLADLPFHMGVDADDWIEPDYVQKLVSALTASPGAAAAFGTQVFFGNTADAGLRWPSRAPDRTRRFLECFMPGAGVLFRSPALRATGGWRKEFSSLYEDWELWIRMEEQGQTLTWVPDALYHYRRHADSALNRWSRSKTALFNVRLLRRYRKQIAAAVGTDAFLSRDVVPEIRAALRSGRLGWGLSLASRSLAAAPLSTLRLLLTAYGRRLEEGWTRKRAVNG